MIRISKIYYLLLFTSVLMFGCKKEFSKFYDRPENLGAPIYQQLETKGNFKHLLSAIDKAGYKTILSEQGWWTFFAPTDAAFETFYQENNIDGDNGLTDSLAKSIVKYSLVYNSYREDQISTFQTSNTTEVTEGMAFKRKTAYYDWVQEKGDAVHAKIIATNRNVSTARSGNSTTNVSNYVDGDNNNKYIPYITSTFLTANNLTAEGDFKPFYPNTTFTGFNVAGASVDPANKDIAAENGMIHIIDKVIVPLPNIDQYINSKSEYSDFAKLLDSLKYYTANAYVTNKYRLATGKSDSVYVKGYNGQLAFSPNNENYQIPGLVSFINTLSQKQSWSILTPTNAALATYRNKILKKYGNTFFGTTPISILIDFLNSHMWPEAMWPSQFKLKENYLLEGTTVELTNAVDKKILSNGLFYGIDKANEANVFRTVYGVPYLDPNGSLTYNAYKDLSTGIKSYVLQPGVRQTLFVMPNNVLSNAGWTYKDNATQPWGYRSSPTADYSYSTIYRENILRMFSTGVLITPTAEINNFSGQGILETKSGDYIKYDNGKIKTTGTMDSGVDLNVTGPDNSSINGNVFYVDGLLSFTEKNVGQQIEDLATKYPSSYGSFYWFLLNGGVSVYNKTTKAIPGVNTGTDNKYTFLIPDNAAIANAIKAGLLPGTVSTGALPTSAPTSAIDLEKVRKFILYHIIRYESIASDGKKSDNFITLLQTEAGAPTLINVLNNPGNMIVTDRHTPSTSALVTESVSNQLGNRSVIHSINNYLNFND